MSLQRKYSLNCLVEMADFDFWVSSRLLSQDFFDFWVSSGILSQYFFDLCVLSCLRRPHLVSLLGSHQKTSLLTFNTGSSITFSDAFRALPRQQYQHNCEFRFPDLAFPQLFFLLLTEKKILIVLTSNKMGGGGGGAGKAMRGHDEQI